ncbi:MAG: hypothetical protein ACI90V_005916, partial [Bacillariaceae sp.]
GIICMNSICEAEIKIKNNNNPLLMLQCTVG